MLPAAYLLLIESTEHLKTDHSLIILNNAGICSPIFGRSAGSAIQELRIVQKPKKELHDLIEAFKQLPDHIHTIIIPLSKPLKDNETAAIRKLFSQAGLDTSDVTDEQIHHYIYSLMEGAYRYYIDFDHSKTYAPIAIKPITSHPQYNPFWQDQKIDLAAISDNKEFTTADFIVKEINFTEYLPDPSEKPAGMK